MSAHALIGTSTAMRTALARAESAAITDVPLLLLGESGSGKECFSRHVHACSKRSERAFIGVNATALPFHLLESELFGHERGAFTGADRARNGLFQEANGGTLLIDEIGDLPLPLQAKLLRVLQEGEIRPVGRARPLPVDVRVIAATHRDLGELVRRGEFREDLYYRVSVFHVRVPPLRERVTDILALARHFLRRHGCGASTLSEAACEVLERHPWPGNVRELENACRHALVLCPRGPIEPAHLPLAVVAGLGPARPSLTLWEARDEAERERIAAMLSATDGNRTEAARGLGMSRQSLHVRLRRFGFAGPRAPRLAREVPSD